MHFSKQKPGEKPDLSQPRQSFYSAPIDRLNSGFINMVSGPFELVNQLREEIKRTNPVRALIPGIFRGVSWFVVREAVGIFEIGTFFVPWKPHLEPIDLDWLSV
ncbi:MAG: exosortase system-associated protein, TIGR04073 family [Candidatus Omnitrophica bacterium]|nr:exosortase system-associated protein, TIGR04073 family [Candidatus Omnitrophota bacterium]